MGNFSQDEDDLFDIFNHFQAHQEWIDFHRHFIDFEMKSRIIHEFEPEHVSFDDSQEYIEQYQTMNGSDSDSVSSDDVYGDDQEYDPDDMESNKLNWNPFRDSIYSNLMPHIEYLSHFGLFQDYTQLNIANNARFAPNNTDSLYLQYIFAETLKKEKYLILNLRQRPIQRQKKNEFDD